MTKQDRLYELDAEATMNVAIGVADRVVKRLGFRQASEEEEKMATVHLATAIFLRLHAMMDRGHQRPPK